MFFDPDKGVFKYIEQNSKQEGSESIGGPNGTSLSTQVGHFAKNGEQCVVFCKSKRECVETAQSLIRQMNPIGNVSAASELTHFDDSIAKETLSELLKFGVAYHNSDLTWDLRDLIERKFRSGEIRVICATSTLAMGLNLPVRNVFIDPLRWERNRAGHFYKVPLSQAEFENMSGRAGRLGQSQEFGRAIIFTESKFDSDTYFRTYIQGSLPELTPTLESDALCDHILNLVAAKHCNSRGQLRTFLLSSYSGEFYWRGEENEAPFNTQLVESIEHCVDNNLIRRSGQKLEVTPLGRLIAMKGISAETGMSLSKFIVENCECATEMRYLEFLLLLADSDESQANQMKMRKDEWYDGSFEIEFLHLMSSLQPIAAQRLRHYYYQRPQTSERMKSVKKVVMLTEWIRGVPLDRLELHFDCQPGAIRSMAAELSWLCDALEAIAALKHWPSSALLNIRCLTQRLAYGVASQALVFCEAHIRKLDRSHAMALAQRGIRTLEEAAAMPMSELEKVIPQYIAMNLIQHVRSMPPPEQKVAPKSGVVVTAELETTADSKGNVWKAAGVKLIISGQRDKQRAVIKLDGKNIGLQNQSFEALVRLVVALKSDGTGWVPLTDFGTSEIGYKIVQRLRAGLQSSGLETDLIENDGAKRYRLSIPPAQIEFDQDAVIRSFPDLAHILKPLNDRYSVAS